MPVLRYTVSRCHESRALGVNKHPPRPEPELQSWAGSGVSWSLCVVLTPGQARPLLGSVIQNQLMTCCVVTCVTRYVRGTSHSHLQRIENIDKVPFWHYLVWAPYFTCLKICFKTGVISLYVCLWYRAILGHPVTRVACSWFEHALNSMSASFLVALIR